MITMVEHMNNILSIKTIVNNNNRVKETSYFEIASLSKVIYAFIIYKLCEMKILSLSDLVCSFNENYQFSTNSLYKKIRVNMVLNHTTGLPNWCHENDKYFVSEPGNRFVYSGEGYFYLQKSIESMTNKSVQSLIDKYINNPLKLSIFSKYNENIQNKLIIPNSHYEPIFEENVAYSFYATYKDYYSFLDYAFFNTNYFDWAIKNNIYVKKDITWNSGFGLINNQFAFQYGDNGDYKSVFIIDVKNRQIYLSFSNYFEGLIDGIIEYHNKTIVNKLLDFLKNQYGDDFDLLFDN